MRTPPKFLVSALFVRQTERSEGEYHKFKPIGALNCFRNASRWADCAFAQENFNFTVINSTGGMLQEPEVCMLVGFESSRMAILLDIVRKDCRPCRNFVSTQGYLQAELANPPMVETVMGGARFLYDDGRTF